MKMEYLVSALQAMNQNQVKLLWGLRARQTPPSILPAPSAGNLLCAANTICRKASLPCRQWVCHHGEGWRGGRIEGRCRGPKEGRSAVGAEVCLNQHRTGMPASS